MSAGIYWWKNLNIVLSFPSEKLWIDFAKVVSSQCSFEYNTSQICKTFELFKSLLRNGKILLKCKYSQSISQTLAGVSHRESKNIFIQSAGISHRRNYARSISWDRRLLALNNMKSVRAGLLTINSFICLRSSQDCGKILLWWAQNLISIQNTCFNLRILW